MRILIPALAVCLAGMWSGCTTESQNDPPLRKPAIVVPSRIRSVQLGSTDTAVTLLRYDSLGMLTREIRSTSIKEWDSLGRYLGVRVKDSARYLEQVAWIGLDSTVRTQPPSLVLHDRFFNRHPNCWCADSIRHTMDDRFVATRKFTFDASGNPVRVTLTWANDGRVEVVQLYQNTYDTTGRLVGVYVQDGESGTVVTSIRFLEYDTLKNVTEKR
jgi:hypothetical protein